MTNFSAMTVPEAIASLRDIFFVVSLTLVGWKARSWLQPAYDFFKRANDHMDAVNRHMLLVETGMNTLLGNHLKHMEADLRRLAARQVQEVHQVEPVTITSGEKPIYVVAINRDELSKLLPPDEET